ncbi:acyl-CoA--6-aminopenicillanic acid acyl-transferase [Bizionia argentinensis JUB59]|uniref:Acyl-CoA--6-aminopenicillanic acid acyl-transferase n=1 Tax=Bizionia argentinensis JUB59 TaxID=1046627 RepID=G2EF88_9FLAO|nr:acyl-CoA--6-aminopenicillanic acid acyl-transferase [Bizionia argentinensis]EGV42883.1 acyl-CoA--6-aminopenicillanic acid acyl-transferase [Bizionia argentinensis JUB59]
MSNSFWKTLVFTLILSSCGVKKSLHDTPDISIYNQRIPERIKISDTTFTTNNGLLTKNKYGQWELYVSGDPYQIGLQVGSLGQELMAVQEHALLSKVEEFVPSKTKQYLLRKLLAFYNRKMHLHVPEEYKSEILGVSKYAGDTYDYVAEDYLRLLYFHSAHDIGHALQDLALVGCSSFAAWGDKTEDGDLIIGRNFDFYAGDEFAENKIIAFIKPTQGYNFMSVTWAGMMGVVSGMNDQGLTVTINAGKSDVPMVAKTPISILTREILQYASNIDEAIAIAKKRQVFVSESILIGSANDKRAITIEVSPNNFGVFKVENSSQLICSNHFQSDAYAADENNLKQIAESHSQYRYERMEELLSETPKLNVKKAVSILRNKDGLDDKAIGFGNEKALNQLLAHHGVVFKPEQGLVWVSANPYQLGAFVAYNLNEIFKEEASDIAAKSFHNEDLTIEADPFQFTQAYLDYEKYRVLSRKISKAISNKNHVEPQVLIQLIKSNPNYWQAYYLVGKYNYEHRYYEAALQAFEKAQSKEITTVPDKETLSKYIKKTQRKLN